MSEPMNIFDLLKEQEEAKKFFIEHSFRGGCRGLKQSELLIIAKGLYEAKYDGNSYQDADKMTHEDILENFCWNYFGLNLADVIKGYDNYLG